MRLLVAAVLLASSPAFAQVREAAPQLPPSLAPTGVVVLDALGIANPADAPEKLATNPAVDDRLSAFLERALQAPAAAPAKAVRASPAEVISSARQELSAFTPDQIKTMPAADLEALSARLMDGARSRAKEAARTRADLPGAGEPASLSERDIDDILALPTEHPNAFPDTGTLSPILKAAPEGRLALAREILARDPNLSKVMLDFYVAFAAAVRAGPPRRALALQQRFDGFLDAVRAPGMAVHYRVYAGRAGHRMLKSGALLQDSIRAKGVLAKIERVKALAAPLVSEDVAPKTPAEAVAGPWKIPTPPTEAERQTPVPEAEVFYVDLKTIGAEAERRAFALERLLKRTALAKDARFSNELRRSEDEKLREEALDAADWAEWAEHTLTQYTGNRLLNQLMAPRRGPLKPTPLFVPTNKNLALVALPEGLLLRARFVTDIADDKALAFIKESIESYWTADLTTESGSVTPFRTQVEIRRLAPGETFAEGDLRLTESAQFGNYATSAGMTLTRQGLSYGTPAHEFGHVLGLEDEYQVDYDVRNRRIKHTNRPRSLMSSSDRGAVQAIHIQTLIQLMAKGGRLFDMTKP